MRPPATDCPRAITTTQAGETGLVNDSGHVQVKVETNTVFRGTLLVPEVRSLSAGALDLLGIDAPAPVLDRAEVFAGKFLAALDRQHPRDLFDVWRLYETGPIEPAMLSAFVVYLCGHNRPPHEILDSTDRMIDRDYTRALVGMVRGELPSIEQLHDVRARLRRDILTGLTTVTFSRDSSLDTPTGTS